MSRLVVLLAFVVLAAPAAGQTRPATETPAADPIAVLPAEVRSLRGELAEAARSSIRLQLLVARLQLQEQRIIYLDRQRSEVARDLAGIQQQRFQFESMFKMFGKDLPKDGPFEGVKQQVARLETQEQELRARENDLLNSLAAEQGRWTDLSSRLEELERSLAR